jgi:hypothetical protein
MENSNTLSKEEKLQRDLDIALWMLASWCGAIQKNGSGWDDWDEYYKDACYRPGPLREQLDVIMEEVKKQYEP